jgi:hypothetical protein
MKKGLLALFYRLRRHTVYPRFHRFVLKGEPGGMAMKQNPLLDIQIFSQSVWLDLIRRGMLSSGELQQLIEEDGLRGVTSNPSIFEKAIAGSHDYDDATRALALEGTSVEDIYQALTMEDVQRTADLFRPIYDQTEGRDGFVSLEVSPHLAYDTTGTISEARRLWAVLDRPNVLIKVPASREGLSAIKQLTYEGINVNVTLLFSLDRYREVTLTCWWILCWKKLCTREVPRPRSLRPSMGMSPLPALR